MAGTSSQQPSGAASPWPSFEPVGEHAGKGSAPFNRPVTLIGSRHTARLHLLSRTVSKAHALAVRTDHGVYLRDLASRAHVYVNGQEIREAQLNDGDLVKIGSFTFRYNDPGVGGANRAKSATPAPPASLDVTGADEPIPIDERVVLIGRRPGSDIQLLEDSVSTSHAVIVELNG